MEQSQSYTKNQIDIFHRYEKKYNFYVDYEMVEPEFSPTWRVYYPHYLQIIPNECDHITTDFS